MSTPLDAFFTTIQNAVTAVNNLGQLLTQATTNSSSLRGTISSTIFGSVTTINTSIGLTGGPITVSGTIALSITNLSNSLASNTALSSNTATYVTGPTVAQGTSGVWFASGQVTCVDAAGANSFSCKLWDGTTVVDSANMTNGGANFRVAVPLSGIITNPTSNIKISVAL